MVAESHRRIGRRDDFFGGRWYESGLRRGPPGGRTKSRRCLIGRVLEPTRTGWRTRREDKARRLDRVAKVARGRVLPTEEIVPALEGLISPGDRVALEGDNQKQADFLSRSLAAVDPEKVHDLHMLISSISRPDHLDLFERGIATRVDFSYAGPQSLRVAQLLGRW